MATAAAGRDQTASTSARVTAILLFAMVVAACGSDNDDADGKSGSGEAWRSVAVAPLGGRFLAAVAWTGREMLVWGGDSCEGACDPAALRTHADGAAYDPLADRWRSLPVSPLSPRFGSLVAWTEREVVIWGGSAGDDFLADGAAYDPDTNSWRLLAPSPLTARFGVPPGTVAQVPGVWTGKELLVWGQGAGVEDPEPALPQGAGYEPGADIWRLLPTAPALPRIVDPVWTGKEMVVWGGQSGRQYFDDGAAYAIGPEGNWAGGLARSARLFGRGVA
ncbi:MAG: hypothetical protein ACRD12_21525 [Acidimicrobiales bacterium]